MKEFEIKLKFAILVILLLIFVPGSPASPRRSIPTYATDSKLLDTKVLYFVMDNETLVDGLWKLAKGSRPFAFGFENVLKPSSTIDSFQEPKFSLELKDKSVREVLDELCKADSRFTWSTDGNTVNVYPRSTENDPSYLLNRKLETFRLQDATDVQHGLLAIVRQLPPPVEQIANAQMGGDDPYPREPWTVSYHNLTVRQIVNRLALHGGPCGIWIFGGTIDFRAFGFFNTYLHCATANLKSSDASISIR
jgi:hypothetical protein